MVGKHIGATLRAVGLAGSLGLGIAATLSGCGGGSASGGGASGPSGGASDSAPAVSPEEQKRQDALAQLKARQDAACETLGPRITECAIADARKTMSKEELAELDLEKTGPAHTQKYVDECKAADYSQRQVRVMEVCQKEESECEPMLACLENNLGPK
jgi:hypothetical protein